MGEVFTSAYLPDPTRRTDRFASPAHPSDIVDLAGIAPALIVTAEFDQLRAGGERYARRLPEAGALVEHYDVPGVDHGHDTTNVDAAREVYALIAHHVWQTTNPNNQDL